MIWKVDRSSGVKIILVIFVISLVFSSCTSLIPATSGQQNTAGESSAAGNPIIYFTVPRDKTEIWSLNRITGEAKYLHGVEFRIAFSEARSSGFLTQETSDFLIAKGMKDDDLLDCGITDLALSPDKQYLAWQEFCFWRIEGLLGGQHNLRVMQLVDETIIEVHQSLERFRSITWSPDSKHLVYTESLNPNLEEQINSKIWLWDVETKEGILFSEGRHPSWSASGDKIGYINEVGIESGELVLIHQDIGTMDKIAIPVKQDFEFEVYDTFVWGPRNEELIVVEENSLWLVDSHSGNVESLIVSHTNLLYSNPLWAPDGQKVAIRYQEEGAAPVLGIIDVERKQIIFDVGEIPDMVAEREWSDDSQSILCTHVNIVSRDNSYRLAVIQIPDGEAQDIPFPDEFFPEFLISKMPIVRGIQIAW
jgi:WD40 repeat protein